MQEQSMRRDENADEEERFKVAPIISDPKLQAFKWKVISTLLGIKFMEFHHTEQQARQRNQQQGNMDSGACKIRLRMLIMYLLLPLIVILPPLLIGDLSLHVVAVLVPAIALPLLTLVHDFVFLQLKNPKHKYMVLMAYGYLWAVHLSITKQLNEQANPSSLAFSNSQYLLHCIVSSLSILTSLSTISLSPTHEFSASTLEYNYSQPYTCHSTLYMRFLIAVPGILLELLIFYLSPMASLESSTSLIIINAVISFVLITWIFGLLSSLYNMCIFIVSRIWNSLIFGESLMSLCGYQMRGRVLWKFTLIVMFGNAAAIAASYGIFRAFLPKFGKDFTLAEIESGVDGLLDTTALQESQRQLVRVQHITLIILSFLTSIVYSISLYLFFRLRESREKSLRKNRESYFSYKSKAEEEKGCLFISRRLIVTTIFHIIVPVALSIMIGIAGQSFFEKEQKVKEFNPQTNQNYPNTHRTVVIAVLGVDIGIYLLYLLVKQLTRTTSKLFCGCSINILCGKNYLGELARDEIFEKFLTCTSALSVLFLVERVSYDLETLSKQILNYGPTTLQQSPSALAFVRYIVIPILIYRSYKRCMSFSYSLHISIILSFFILLADFETYRYIATLVVLAMPIFPNNPFRALLVTPFTIPKKLQHKNEVCLIIGYMIINILTGISYFITLGLFDLTMIFGLPMYWLVVPSTNSQVQLRDDDTDNHSRIMPQPREKEMKEMKGMKNQESKIDQTTSLKLEETNQNLKATMKKKIQQEEEKVQEVEASINSAQSEFVGSGKTPLDKPTTPEETIYRKLIEKLPYDIFQGKEPGYYLIRISKYIILVQLSSSCYKIMESLTLIGLEAQEVTTCHAKEGETIDEAIEQTWPASTLQIEAQRMCTVGDLIEKVLHPEAMVKNVKITAENQIQLTGVIETQGFFESFKKGLIKSLFYLLDKQFQSQARQSKSRNRKTKLFSGKERQFLEEVIAEDLYFMCPKDKCDQIFPTQFMQNQYFHLKCQYPGRDQPSSISSIGAKKLPPIDKAPKIKKQKILDDFMDLLDNSSAIKETEKDKNSNNNQLIPVLNDKKSPFKEQRKPYTTEELSMALILAIYSTIIGKQNFLNIEKLIKILKGQNLEGILSKMRDGIRADLLAAEAIGYAFKIAVGKSLMGEEGEDIELQDLLSYDKSQYLGVLESVGFSAAMQDNNKTDVWVMEYRHLKKQLTVKRMAETKANLYLFSLDTVIVRAIWNNLRFELLYATNDDDERYSIQTHGSLLRNLLVQGCEQPFGYAGFYSQQVLNI